jgi:outer membrane lipoprotein SlyB
MRRQRLAGLPALVVALGLAGCATTTPRPAAPPTAAAPVAAAPASRPASCTTCGRVERIDAAAPSTGRTQGAVLGGVVGGVLAKPAPASVPDAKGAVRNVRIVVLLDSGRRLILTQPPVAGMKVGARVRVDRSRAVLLR